MLAEAGLRAPFSVCTWFGGSFDFLWCIISLWFD